MRRVPFMGAIGYPTMPGRDGNFVAHIHFVGALEQAVHLGNQHKTGWVRMRPFGINFFMLYFLLFLYSISAHWT